MYGLEQFITNNYFVQQTDKFFSSCNLTINSFGRFTATGKAI